MGAYSTLQGAQVFEAVGSPMKLWCCFSGTTVSKVLISESTVTLNVSTIRPTPSAAAMAIVRAMVQIHYRDGAGALNTPAAAMVNLQVAALVRPTKNFPITRTREQKVTLRGQLKFKFDPSSAVPLDGVEPVIVNDSRREPCLGFDQSGAHENSCGCNEQHWRTLEHR
jgi:glutamate synthase (NADPH/NADH)/glutamate synthase (NADPH/NADH) large chain